jgi:hypothetical protein
MADNLVPLDLTRFTIADAEKVTALQQKLWLLRRWCRCDLLTRDGRDEYLLYSGDRGRQPSARYTVRRTAEGRYVLLDGRTGRLLHEGRTMAGAIDALPEDFYAAGS